MSHSSSTFQDQANLYRTEPEIIAQFHAGDNSKLLNKCCMDINNTLLPTPHIPRLHSPVPHSDVKNQFALLLKLAVFIKSEMLREVRENCFSKYQRYPIITIESQNKKIMTDGRHNDVIINYNITNILVTQLELSLQCPPKLLL